MKKSIVVFISLIVGVFVVISIGRYFVKREISQRQEIVDKKWNLLKNYAYLHVRIQIKIDS